MNMKLAGILFASLAPLFAQAFPLDHCVYTLGSNHQNLLPGIYEKFLKDHPVDICPVRFDVVDANDLAKNCEGREPDGSTYSQKAGRAVLDYRNIKGELYTVSYPVCLGTKDHGARIGKLDGNRWKPLQEASIRKDVFPNDKGDRPENENDDCNTNRSVSQKICAPEGYKVYGWEGPINVHNSSQSELQSAVPDPKNPACVDITFLLKGRGYNEAFGIRTDCREHAWYKYRVILHAYTEIPIQKH